MSMVDATDDRSLKSLRTMGTEASSTDYMGLQQGSLDTPSIITIQISHRAKPPRQKSPRVAEVEPTLEDSNQVNIVSAIKASISASNKAHAVNLRRESDARRIQQQSAQQAMMRNAMGVTPAQFAARFNPNSPSFTPLVHNSRPADTKQLQTSISCTSIPSNSNNSTAIPSKREVRYVKGINEQLPARPHSSSLPAAVPMATSCVIQLPSKAIDTSPTHSQKPKEVAAKPRPVTASAVVKMENLQTQGPSPISLLRTQSQRTIESDLSVYSDIIESPPKANASKNNNQGNMNTDGAATERALSELPPKYVRKERPRSTGTMAYRQTKQKQSKLFQQQMQQSERIAHGTATAEQFNQSKLPLIEGLSDKDIAALRIGRLIIGSVINSPQVATSDVISRFFLDNWLSKHGSSAAKADILSIDLMCQLDKYKSIKDFIINSEQAEIIAKLQQEQLLKQQQLQEGQQQSSNIPKALAPETINESKLLLTEPIIEAHKVMAIVAYGALNKLATEYVESSPVLVEIMNGLRPLLFADSALTGSDHSATHHILLSKSNKEGANEMEEDAMESASQERLITWMEKTFEMKNHMSLLESNLTQMEEQNMALREDICVLEQTLQMLQDGQIDVSHIDETISSFAVLANISASASASASVSDHDMFSSNNNNNNMGVKNGFGGGVFGRKPSVDVETVLSNDDMDEDDDESVASIKDLQSARFNNIGGGSAANSRSGSISMLSGGNNSGIGMLRTLQRRPTFKGLLSISNRGAVKPIGRDATTQTEAFAGYKPMVNGPMQTMHQQLQSQKANSELKTLQIVIDTLTAELAEMSQKVDTSDIVDEMKSKLAEANKTISELTDANKQLVAKNGDLANKITSLEQRQEEERDKITASVNALVEKLSAVRITADQQQQQQQQHNGMDGGASVGSGPATATGGGVAGRKGSTSSVASNGSAGAATAPTTATGGASRAGIADEIDYESGENLTHAIKLLTDRFNIRNRKRSKLTVSDYLSAISNSLLTTLEAGIANRNDLLQRISLDKMSRDRKEKELRTELDAKKKEISSICERLRELDTQYVTIKQETSATIAKLTTEVNTQRQLKDDELIRTKVLTSQMEGYRRTIEQQREAYEEQLNEAEHERRYVEDCMLMAVEDNQHLHDGWIVDKIVRKVFERERNQFLKENILHKEKIKELEEWQTKATIELDDLNDKLRRANEQILDLREEIDYLKADHIKEIAEIKELHQRETELLQLQISSSHDNLLKAKQNMYAITAKSDAQQKEIDLLTKQTTTLERQCMFNEERNNKRIENINTYLGEMFEDVILFRSRQQSSEMQLMENEDLRIRLLTRIEQSLDTHFDHIFAAQCTAATVNLQLPIDVSTFSDRVVWTVSPSLCSAAVAAEAEDMQTRLKKKTKSGKKQSSKKNKELTKKRNSKSGEIAEENDNSNEKEIDKDKENDLFEAETENEADEDIDNTNDEEGEKGEDSDDEADRERIALDEQQQLLDNYTKKFVVPHKRPKLPIEYDKLKNVSQLEYRDSWEKKPAKVVTRSTAVQQSGKSSKQQQQQQEASSSGEGEAAATATAPATTAVAVGVGTAGLSSPGAKRSTKVLSTAAAFAGSSARSSKLSKASAAAAASSKLSAVSGKVRSKTTVDPTTSNIGIGSTKLASMKLVALQPPSTETTTQSSKAVEPVESATDAMELTTDEGQNDAEIMHEAEGDSGATSRKLSTKAARKSTKSLAADGSGTVVEEVDDGDDDDVEDDHLIEEGDEVETEDEDGDEEGEYQHEHEEDEEGEQSHVQRDGGTGVKFTLPNGEVVPATAVGSPSASSSTKGSARDNKGNVLLAPMMRFIGANEREIMHENGQLRITLRECIGLFHRIRRAVEELAKTNDSLTLTHTILQVVKPEAEKLVDYKNIAEADSNLLEALREGVQQVLDEMNQSKRWLLTPHMQDDEHLQCLFADEVNPVSVMANTRKLGIYANRLASATDYLKDEDDMAAGSNANVTGEEVDAVLLKDFGDGVKGLMKDMVKARSTEGDWKALLLRADGSVDVDMPIEGWSPVEKVLILNEKLEYVRKESAEKVEKKDTEIDKLKQIIVALLSKANPNLRSTSSAAAGKHAHHPSSAVSASASSTAASTTALVPTAATASTEITSNEAFDKNDPAVNNAGTGSVAVAATTVVAGADNGHVVDQLHSAREFLPQDHWDLNEIAINLNIDTKRSIERDTAVFRRMRDAVLSGKNVIDFPLYTDADIQAMQNKIKQITSLVNMLCAANIEGASKEAGEAIKVMTNATHYDPASPYLSPHLPMMSGLGTSANSAGLLLRNGVVLSPPASPGQTAVTSPKLNYQFIPDDDLPISKPTNNSAVEMTDDVEDEPLHIETQMQASQGPNHTHMMPNSSARSELTSLNSPIIGVGASLYAPNVPPPQHAQLRPMTASLTLSHNKGMGALVGKIRPFSSSQLRNGHVSAVSTAGPALAQGAGSSDVLQQSGFEPGLSKKMKLVNPLQQPVTYGAMTSTSVLSVGSGWGVHTPVPALAQPQQGKTGNKSFVDQHTRSGWRKVESDARRERGLNIVRQSYEERLEEIGHKQQVLSSVAPTVLPLQNSLAASSIASASGNAIAKAEAEVIPIKVRSRSSSPTKNGATSEGNLKSESDAISLAMSNNKLQQRTLQMIEDLNNCTDIIQSRILFGIRPVPEIIAKAEADLSETLATFQGNQNQQLNSSEQLSASNYEARESAVKLNHSLLMTVLNGVKDNGNSTQSPIGGVSCYEDLYEIAAKQHKLRDVTAVSHKQRESEIISYAEHLNSKINRHIRAVQELEAQLVQLGSCYYDNRLDTCVKASKQYEMRG